MPGGFTNSIRVYSRVVELLAAPLHFFPSVQLLSRACTACATPFTPGTLTAVTCFTFGPTHRSAPGSRLRSALG